MRFAREKNNTLTFSWYQTGCGLSSGRDPVRKGTVRFRPWRGEVVSVQGVCRWHRWGNLQQLTNYGSTGHTSTRYVPGLILIGPFCEST